MDRDSRRAKAAELVEKYGSALFRLCLVMLRNAADAEDAVQEALLRYIERAPEFESPEAERAWLFTVASNRCRDALRAARRHPQLTLDELAGLGAEESDLGVLDALMRQNAAQKGPRAAGKGDFRWRISSSAPWRA